MHRACLLRRSRLISSGEFNQVFSHAVRSSDNYLTVLAKNNDRDYPRLGLAISRKNAKLAVVRNRIKRIVRESFRLNQASLQNADYVVLARGKTAKANNKEVLASIENHWKRLFKLCAES